MQGYLRQIAKDHLPEEQREFFVKEALETAQYLDDQTAGMSEEEKDKYLENFAKGAE